MKKVMIAFIVSLGLMGSVFAAPVDINVADAKTLAKELRGVGPEKAEAIVQYRKTHGPFRTVDELSKVKGIGKKTVETNRANLVVSLAK
jgi:competence protein ComEA